MGYNTVLKAFGNIGDIQSAENWYNSMLSDDIQPNGKTYGKLVYAAAKAGQAERVRFWFRRIVDGGFKTNAEVVNLAMKFN